MTAEAGMGLTAAGVLLLLVVRRLWPGASLVLAGTTAIWAQLLSGAPRMLAPVPIQPQAASARMLLLFLPLAAAVAGATLQAGGRRARQALVALGLSPWLVLPGSPADFVVLIPFLALLPARGPAAAAAADGWRRINREQSALLAAVALGAVLAIAGLRLNDPVSATAGPLLLALGTALLLGMWPFSGDPGPASADSDSAQLQSALWLALLAAPLLTGVEGLREGLRATGMEQATAAALAVIGALNLGAAAVWPAIDRRWGSVWAAAWWGDSGLAVLGLAAGTEPALRGALLLLVLQMVPRVLLAWPAGGAWRRAALLAGAGLPLTAAFAARLYVLEQLSPLGAGMLAFAVIASTVAGAWQTWAAISGPAPALPRGQEMQRWLGAATLAGSAAVGLVPRLAGALLGIR